MSQTDLHDTVQRLDELALKLGQLETLQREFLNSEESAKFLGLSKQTIDLWRSSGGGPAWHKVGRRVLYSVHDLREFMAGHRREPLL